ncbi:30S ribosomal protein S16 [Cytophagaceae bacterium ABcell3]|nr:30S ribosomal protein S16 [Cytophagaceae bacterium ABcell3]
MAVKIRLARRGRKQRAMYDIVVADARAPRDGRFIEKLGTYNPNTNPADVDLDAERALKWVMNGAQPTDTARSLLSDGGVMLKKHLQVGVNKGAITQEQADKKFEEWKAAKEKSATAKVTAITDKKAAEAKARQEAEEKVNQARIEAQKAKQAEVAAALEDADAKTEEAGEAADAVDNKEGDTAE